MGNNCLLENALNVFFLLDNMFSGKAQKENKNGYYRFWGHAMYFKFSSMYKFNVESFLLIFWEKSGLRSRSGNLYYF